MTHVRTRMARGERGLTPVPPTRQSRQSRQPGSDETRWKRGATALGISLDEYVAHIQQGEKWCSLHQLWQPVEDFGNNRAARDGLSGSCRASWRDRIRTTP